MLQLDYLQSGSWSCWLLLVFRDSSFDVGPVTIYSFTELLLCFSNILDVASATYKVGCCASCMCFDVYVLPVEVLMNDVWLCRRGHVLQCFLLHCITWVGCIRFSPIEI